MSFPEHDSYWKNVATFLKKRIKPSDRLLAPLEFRDYFDDQVVDYGAAWSDRLTWVVLHKGMLDAVGLAQLNAIDAYCVPVFANEVFVVFSQARGIKRLSLDSPHLQAYRVQKERAYRAQLEAIAPAAHADQATRERESIYLGHHRALTRTIWGHKMFVDTEDVSITPHLLLDGYWELWVTRLFQDWVQPGMRVVDVGSNIGYFTLIAASQVGQAGHVYAFEPNPSTFELLQRNVEINGLGDRTTLIQKAVFSESKTVRFHHLKQHHAYSSLNLYPDESLRKLQDESIAFDVDAISLDEYFAEFNAAIDVVKIDIEGREPDVLRGMQMLIRQNPKLAIICEFESYRFQQAGTDPGAFLRELHDWGLVMRLINDQSQLVDVSVETLLNLKSYCYLLLTH